MLKLSNITRQKFHTKIIELLGKFSCKQLPKNKNNDYLIGKIVINNDKRFSFCTHIMGGPNFLYMSTKCLFRVSMGSLKSLHTSLSTKMVHYLGHSGSLNIKLNMKCMHTKIQIKNWLLLKHQERTLKSFELISRHRFHSKGTARFFGVQKKCKFNTTVIDLRNRGNIFF